MAITGKKERIRARRPGTTDGEQPTPSKSPRPQLLGRLLMASGALPEPALVAALEEQRRTGVRLGEILVRSGVVDEEAVARALAVQLGLEYAEPPLEPDAAAVRLVGAELARDRKVLPLTARGRSIRLAMADPLDVDGAEDVRFHSGRRVEPLVASPTAVTGALARAYGGELPELVDALPDRLTRDPDAARDALEAAASAAPVVRLVDHLLKRAVAERASDIHVEHRDGTVQVRYRIDGVLRGALQLPPASRSAVLSRIKVMAGMDISVKRRPQDGGFALRVGDTSLTLRVSTLPVTGGEKAVLRILDPRSAPRDLSALGMAEGDLRRFRALLGAGQGVILAAGPTGSGKSSTLAGALAELDREALNVTTLEDPVEYRLAGVNQVQVQPRAGLTFPAALRSVLRQDPDVIMVGEIRDRETAEIAMAAAMTGHLVLSTIHTTDAPGAITRLLDMGVPPFLVAGGLSGVVAQRLVRRLCRACGGRGGECTRCVDGYRGRTGVFQLLVMADGLRDEVIRGGSTASVRRLAVEGGMGSLADDARRKVAEGATTPHEMARVVQVDPGAHIPCPRCEGEVPATAPGCPHCGQPRLRICSCGRTLGRAWRFCPWCLRKAGPGPEGREGVPA